MMTSLSHAKKSHIWSQLGNTRSILKFSPSLPFGIVATAAVMGALIACVYAFNIPNPNMILIAGLVVCSAVFGIAGGVTGALAMLGYTMFFFSTEHDFVTFTYENATKVGVTAIGVFVTALFVSSLRQIETKAFSELEEIAVVLEEDNHELEEASATDSLTGTRNRFALRRDFAGYVGKDLCVMMLDIDDFKHANDTFGHAAGDKVLNSIGSQLMECCSPECVYRYGGDEFLAISPGMSPADFERKTAELRERIREITVEGSEDPVHFSAGYVYGKPAAQSDLRLMIRQADMNLYESKGAGKDRVTGCKFSRSRAEAGETSHPSGSTRTPIDRTHAVLK
ncbi:MAG TPA: hypothetical protein DCP91_06260 [Eggerthellaceae bacterium]|nr:hypothetical protein [Eggerthellaceae bacterium]